MRNLLCSLLDTKFRMWASLLAYVSLAESYLVRIRMRLDFLSPNWIGISFNWMQ